MGALILSHADVHAVLDPHECEAAMAIVLAANARGEAHFPLRSVWYPPDAPGLMGLMPAYTAGANASAGAANGDQPGVFALKAICLIRSNPARGLDAHQGVVTLFDHDTGVPTAVINASAITEIRTAAVTAVATRNLARDDAHVLAILGAGVQCRSHLQAFEGLRYWTERRVFAPTIDHARAIADEVPGVIVAPSAREAVDGADVVVTATSSTEPVIEYGWLASGVHVNAVGASAPTSREIDVETVAWSALFCDSRESVRNEAGEFILAKEQGAISGDDHIRGELGEVLVGSAPGRADADEQTLFRSLGVAIEDLAAAQLAVARARERGIGTEVEL